MGDDEISQGFACIYDVLLAMESALGNVQRDGLPHEVMMERIGQTMVSLREFAEESRP